MANEQYKLLSAIKETAHKTNVILNETLRKEDELIVLEKIELDVIFENPEAIDKILKFLKEWLINHILISDKDFAPFLYS